MASITSGDVSPRPRASKSHTRVQRGRTSRAGRTRTRTSVVGDWLARPMASYYLVLVPTALLVGLGELMVLSSSSLYLEQINQSPYAMALKQLVFLAIGVPTAWWLSRRDERTLRRLAWPAMGLAVVLLLAVFSPLGTDQGKGNRAWLSFGGMSLQPSELAKLALILFCANLLHAKQRLLDRPKELVPIVLGFGVIVALVLAEKDLGTALVIGVLFFAMLWIVGVQWRLLAAMVGVAAVGVLGLVITSPNRMTRIFAFMRDTSSDPYASKQPIASVYALASGGWWGFGIGGSRQKWGALADGAQNDFVFAVLGEELGLVGAASVLLLFLVLGYAGIRIALRSDSVFTRVVAAGCTSWLLFQALINIAVAMKMAPVMGVPLPFISAGGSALFANILAIGVLLACARQEPAARRATAARRGEQPPRVTTVVDAGPRPRPSARVRTTPSDQAG